MVLYVSLQLCILLSVAEVRNSEKCIDVLVTFTQLAANSVFTVIARLVKTADSAFHRVFCVGETVFTQEKFQVNISGCAYCMSEIGCTCTYSSALKPEIHLNII
jgi:hypothetical protein